MARGAPAGPGPRARRVDKPAGVTSHDVVGMLRKRFDERRIGHAGTLDPGATGVLVVGVGTVTRLLRFVADGRKRYTGEVVLGVETDTLDADGEVTARHEMGAVTVADAQHTATTHLTGDISQVPPMVSALKVGGRRLHDLARQGVVVEREARPVTVYSFDVDGDRRSVRPRDRRRVLGRDLRSRARRRPRAAPGRRSPPAQPAAHSGRAVHDRRGSAAGRGRTAPARRSATGAGRRCRSTRKRHVWIATGRVLPVPDGQGPWALVDSAGELLAVYEPFRDGQAKPAVVLARGD